MRARESSNVWAVVKRHDLLEFSSVEQLWGIIGNQWATFESVFQDKPRTEASFAEFRDWRNVLAHGYRPSGEEVSRILHIAVDLGAKIFFDVPVPAPALRREDQPKGPSVVPWPPGESAPPFALSAATILWADDHPENNRNERRLLADLGATVIPVLTNDEAVSEVTRSVISLVVSDIGRDEGESGLELPTRLEAIGRPLPLVFYAGRVDRLPVPAGAVAVTDDPADLLKLILLALDSLGLLSSHPTRLGRDPTT